MPLVQARRATTADIPSLVSLREAMLNDMVDAEPSSVEAGQVWRSAAEEWFRQQLLQPARFAAFLVDGADGTPVSSAAGLVHEDAPSSRNPTGLHGTIFNVVTLPQHRGRGHAAAVVTTLLDWFDHDTEVLVVDLHATSVAVPLYERMGFRVPRDLALRRMR